MFKINKVKKGDYTAYQLKNVFTEEYAEILPEAGAILNAFVLKSNKDELVNVIDGYSDEQLVGDVPEEFKSAILVPFPNRIRGGKYNFKGKDYQLNMNFPDEGNAIHGLIYKEEFTVEEAIEESTRAYLLLRFEYAGKSQGYPFPFNVEVCYEFNESGLRVNTQVTNVSGREIPMGLGWHPYFKTGTKVDKMLLEIPKNREIFVNEKMIPTGQQADYQHFRTLETIQEVELDTAFVYMSPVDRPIVKLRDPEKDISLDIWMEGTAGKYQFVQIYTPADRNSIAIEPMTCPANAFNNGAVVDTTLAADDTLSVTYGILRN